MLINGYASSGGDALPYYFRMEGLGPLIGTRTWGGLIGISGNPMLVDGGGVLYPTFRFYGTDGEWAVENVGVAPDHEVIEWPEQCIAGSDPQLDRAVEMIDLMLEHAAEEPVTCELDLVAIEIPQAGGVVVPGGEDPIAIRREGGRSDVAFEP